MKLTFTKTCNFLLSVVGSILLLSTSTFAQVNISGGTTITENFDGMSATSPTATLPTHWRVAKSTAVRTVAGPYSSAGTATERSGGNNIGNTAGNGIYNFGDGTASSDRAVGGLSSNTASKSVTVFTHLTNTGTAAISDFTISYEAEKYRNGSNTAGFLIEMFYSTDGTNWTNAGSSFTATFPGNSDNNGFASAPGDSIRITNQTLSVPLAANGNLYLAWNYSVASGTTSSNAQALGVDDISITANSASVSNPVPTATSLSPNNKTAGDAAFTLTVTGTNFVNGSVVNFNGSAKTTTFVSATSITAAITATDIATAGTYNVTVTNPAPGGGTSSPALTFTVSASTMPSPVPTLTSISPASKTEGDAAFTLTATGTNFTGSSVINFNGVAKTTTFVSATSLTATITAAEIATAGTFPVTVTTPANSAGGGGTSGNQTFTVNTAPVTYLAIAQGNTKTENFDGIGAAAAATLPTGWYVGKIDGTVRTVNAFSAAVKSTERTDGNNMSTTAGNGIYNFGAGVAASATDRAVGGLSSGTNARSVNLISSIRNTGTSAISSFSISYDVEKYRNGSNTAGFRMQLYYSTDGTTWTDAGASFLTTFPADTDNNGFASAPGVTVPVTNKSLNVSVNAGSFLYLAWNYSVSSGTSGSNAQALAVDNIVITANGPNPLPVLTSISPNTKTAGSLSFTLTATGSGFVNSSVINFDGKARPTTYVSATELTAIIPASDVDTAGTFPVAVFSPTTGGGGGTSASVNFTVTAPTQPEILISTTSLTAFSTTVGTPSAVQNYQVSGTALTTGITITAPTGFQISLASGSGYGSTLTLTLINGAIPATTIYTRYNPATSGPASGNIVHTSTGATTKNIAVTGNALSTAPTSQPAISFGSVTQNSIVVNLAGGNGQKRLLLVKSGSAVNGTPVDGTTYTANAAFGSGSQIGTGNYVVFAGTGNSVTVTGLSGGITYHFSVFAYNDDSNAGGENYMTTSPGTGNETTGLPAPNTYTWNTASGNWNTAASWSPARTTPLPNDILVFNGSVRSNPIATLDFTSPASIGQLRFINGVIATLRVSANKMLTLNHDISGADLYVDATSQLIVTNTVVNTSLTIQLLAGETAQISGDLTFTGFTPTSTTTTNAAAHKLYGEDAGSIVFEANSVFTAGNNFSGNAFGNTTTVNAGTTALNSVLFKNGASYFQRAGSNPFGANAPNSLVVFEPESSFLLSPVTGATSILPSLSGRVYGNFELEDPAFASTLSGSGTWEVNNIIITDVNQITFSLAETVIKGNIRVDTGTVNINGADVIFNGTTMQTITGAGNLTFGNNANILVGSGATVSLQKNAAINGTLEVDGTFTMDALSTLTFGGSALRTISGSGSITLSNAVIDASGVQLSNNLNISRLLRLNGNLTTNGRTFTLLSNAAGTAMVVNSGGVVIGSATVQRYIDPTFNSSTGYRHYSSPVANTTINDLSMGSFRPRVNPAYNTASKPAEVSPYPTIFTYNQNRLTNDSAMTQEFTFGWESPTALTNPLIPGRGYTVNIPANATVDFNGTLNNSSITLNNLNVGPTAESGWHFIGNPYPSPIDWDQVTVPSGMGAGAWIYRSSGRYAGSYVSYINGVGPTGADIIPAMQAFFVRATSNVSSFTFTNAARLTTYENPSFYRVANDTRPILALGVMHNKQKKGDQAFVYFEKGAKEELDPAFDAAKMMNGDVLVYTKSGEEDLAINGLEPAQISKTIPVVVWAAAGDMEFSVDKFVNFDACEVVLTDTKLNKSQILSEGSTYKFKFEGGKNESRFALQLNPKRDAAAGVKAVVYPNPNGGEFKVYVNGIQADKAEVTFMNQLGQVLFTKTIEANRNFSELSVNQNGLAKGIYLMQVTDGKTKTTQKIVIQ